jgi:hypothetical protein
VRRFPATTAAACWRARWLGGALAAGAMEWFSFAAQYPLAEIPFATSIVLVIGSPNVEPRGRVR